jgi:SAM-dependent methyltransferase
MWQAIHSALLRLDETAPQIRRIIPARITDDVAAFFGSRINRNNPDRRWLIGAILPALRDARPARVLFVGCRPYTRPYEDFFTGAEYWTMDIEPEVARWGSRRHRTGDVRFVDGLFDGGYFDCVLLNGVFGWGVDRDEDIDRTLDALRTVLRPGGLLLVGWNQGRCADPLTRPVARLLFRHEAALGLPARKSFDDSTHVFDLLTAQAETPVVRPAAGRES